MHGNWEGDVPAWVPTRSGSTASASSLLSEVIPKNRSERLGRVNREGGEAIQGH